MTYTKVIEQVVGHPWAILPTTAAIIAEVLNRHVAGERLTASDVEARIAGRSAKLKAVKGGVGILPVTGILAQRMDAMQDVSGGTSTDRLGLDFDAMVADPQVGAIVLDIDSPGGSVYGLEALSDKIFAARGQKPIYAVANSMAASAAYFIATAADQVIVAPGGEVGSIGTLAIHEDVSGALKQAGVAVTLFSAGKHKADRVPFGPLSDEAREYEQGRVDDHYDEFVAAVARNRGVKNSAVRSGFGEGRMVGAKAAVAEGMADRVATLETVVSELTGEARAGRKRRAESRRRRLEILR